MAEDLTNATSALAGEIGPLARQKATMVSDEGERILRYGHNQPVVEKLTQLHTKLTEVEQLAAERIRIGTQQLRQQVEILKKFCKFFEKIFKN